MTSITQVHFYIKEHFVPSDFIDTAVLVKALPHLTYSSVSIALWKLSTEDTLITVEKDKGPFGSTEYMVSDTYMELRGHENREAPEPGKKRNRRSKRVSAKA